jgi:hypothetical protein
LDAAAETLTQTAVTTGATIHGSVNDVISADIDDIKWEPATTQSQAIAGLTRCTAWAALNLGLHRADECTSGSQPHDDQRFYRGEQWTWLVTSSRRSRSLARTF